VKKHLVVVDPDAERDLEEIADYIAEHDSLDKAVFVATRIEQSFMTLETLPNRGAHPKELLDYGIRDFREIYFKPYRILYRVLDGESKVVVVLIADGRRDMNVLLARRLLGGAE
jgi:toxin ParE1/3/4